MKRGRKTGAGEQPGKTKSDELRVVKLVAGRHPLELHFAKWLLVSAMPLEERTGRKHRGTAPVRASTDPSFWHQCELEKIAPTAAQYPGLVPWSDPIEDLIGAARAGDEELAAFLENTARLIRAGKHRELFLDEWRLALRYTLKAKYGAPPNREPVAITDLVSDLQVEGVTVSERSVSGECKRLGYKVRGKGR